MRTKEIKEYGKSINDSVYLSFDMSYRDSSEYKIIALRENIYSIIKVSAFDDDDIIRRKIRDVINDVVNIYNTHEKRLCLFLTSLLVFLRAS